MNQTARVTSTSLDLTPYGIPAATEIVYNPSYEQLFIEETRDELTGLERGMLTESGAIAVDTGRSPAVARRTSTLSRMR